MRDEIKIVRPEVAPNHAWRHTFKTRAMEAGISERISDAITGHSVRGKGPARSVYEHPNRKMLVKAIEAFPRYDL